jgi:exopolysaccharide production protein ExoQ
MVSGTGVTKKINLHQSSRSRALLFVAVIAILAVAFIFADFDWYVSTYPAHTLSADETEARAAAGNPARRLAYSVIGLMGLILLAQSKTKHSDYLKLPLILIGTYFLFCFASVIWSDVPGLTVRRLLILGFCLLGIVGMIQRFSGEDLIQIALFIALAIVATGLLAEITNATFHPFAGDYRFAGTLHPNTQGGICAILVISAFSGLKRPDRGKFFYLAVFMAGLFFLLLTKSRTALLGCLFAIYVATLLSGSPGLRKILSVGLPFFFCLVAVYILLTGADIGGGLSQLLHLGRAVEDAELGSFSGRVPLWAGLMENVFERPFLGYGYNAFWTPDRIFVISSEFDWTVPNAHSVAIDVILNAGLLGGACYLFGYLLATLSVARRCIAIGTPATCFATAIAVFAVISACFESSFSEPKNFETFFALAAVGVILARPESTFDK